MSINSLSDRITGSILAASAGDAMGWMTEFIRSPEELKHKIGVGVEYVTEYHAWSKQVGGKFQGYQDYVAPGEYSDDTQLTVCTAACISSDGCFDSRQFCDREYPAWLEYARGAGGTVKEAAKKIQRKSADWNSNFFTRKLKKRSIDYRDGGANGAAMRISPHVLANIGRWRQAESDIWRNSIVSHGHPRAIIGALLYGYSLNLVLQHSQPPAGQEFVESLGHWVKTLEVPNLQGLHKWIHEWNRGNQETFETIFDRTKKEAVEQLRIVWLALKQNTSPERLLDRLGCFNFQTKGSGLATTIAGIYIFALQPEKTQENIILAANAIGSDTDSIAAFVGGLGGAVFGIDAIPEKWRSQLQDAPFLIHIGKSLANITTNTPVDTKIHPGIANLTTLQLLSRKILQPHLRVAHGCLGLGTTQKVETQSLLTKNKTVTIVEVRFDIGQSCKFAFRNDNPSQNLFLA